MIWLMLYRNQRGIWSILRTVWPSTRPVLAFVHLFGLVYQSQILTCSMLI